MITSISLDDGPKQQGLRFLDVRRTDLHGRFFHMYQYRLASELLHDLERLPIDYDAFAGSRDAKSSGYSGWLYWLLFLKGYTQYRQVGGVDDSNVYHRYLTRSYAEKDADPTLRSLASSGEATARILRRFGDCDRLSTSAIATRIAETELMPVTVFVREPPVDDDTISVYSVDSEQPIMARLVDGHHRLFAARLFGIKRVRFRVLAEDKVVPDVPGLIDNYSFDGKRLQLTGSTSPLRTAQCVEVRSRGRALCRVPLIEATASERGTNTPLGPLFTFSVDIEVSTPDVSLPLDVMMLDNWLPVGRLAVDPTRTLPVHRYMVGREVESDSMS